MTKKIGIENLVDMAMQKIVEAAQNRTEKFDVYGSMDLASQEIHLTYRISAIAYLNKDVTAPETDEEIDDRKREMIEYASTDALRIDNEIWRAGVRAAIDDGRMELKYNDDNEDVYIAIKPPSKNNRSPKIVKAGCISDGDPLEDLIRKQDGVSGVVCDDMGFCQGGLKRIECESHGERRSVYSWTVQYAGDGFAENFVVLDGRLADESEGGIHDFIEKSLKD